MSEDDAGDVDSVALLRRDILAEGASAKYGEILGLIEILDDCLVAATYRVDDDWVKPICLSPLGESIATELMQKHRRLKPNEARLSVFLAFGCAAGLLVDLSTDVPALRRKLSTEILNRRLHFAWIFGRELHDAAASKYGERTQLTHAQSMALVSQLPIGVFQSAHSLVGPFGCLESREYRDLAPSRNVPGYLCSDETCQGIHSITLETGSSAINRAREFTSNLLDEKYSEKPDDHAAVIAEAILCASGRFDRLTSSDLVDVLADALAEDELRALADSLVRRFFRQEGARAELSRAIQGAISNPTEFVGALDRAHLLQLILWFSDREISEAVDRSVRTGTLRIGATDMRVHRISRWRDRTQVQIGPLGIRVAGGPNSGHVTRQLFRLLHTLYFESPDRSPADLAYLLDLPADSASSPDLLASAVMNLAPRELLRTTALGQRHAALMSADFFGVIDAAEMDRDELLENLLWKLGLPGAPQFSELDKVEEHCERLERAGRLGEGEDVLRGYISNVFAAVEDSAQRSLVFTAWALTEDHFTSSRGFEYDPSQSAEVLEFLDKHAPTNADVRLSGTGKNTLVPLAAGFSRLAKSLKGLNPDLYLRPSHQHPVQCRFGSRPFALPHTIPALDLTGEALEDLIAALNEAGRVLQDEVVLRVRNATVHGNNQFPPEREVEYAVSRLRLWRELLLNTGMFPQIFERTDSTEDSFGRETLTYRSRGGTAVFQRPHWPLAPRLPLGQPRLIVLTAANIPGAAAMRFTIKPRAGEDPYWAGWPRRWKTRTEYGASTSAQSAAEPLTPAQSA